MNDATLEDRIDECYLNLANHIIVQAANDIENSLVALSKDRFNPEARELLFDAVNFMYSKWYKVITKVNPDYIIRKLKEAAQVRIDKYALKLGGQ